MEDKSRPETLDELANRAIEHESPEVQQDWLWPVLADIKEEWRAANGQYARALFLGAAVYFLGELVAKTSQAELEILGFKITDRVILLRLLGPVSGYLLVAAVSAWAAVFKAAQVHHSLLAKANPYLGDERLYEALVPMSVATRLTVITDIVPTEYNRPRSGTVDIIKSIPNAVVDFLIPLILLGFSVRLGQLSFVQTGFDLWELISLLIILLLITFAVSTAIVEFMEIAEP